MVSLENAFLRRLGCWLALDPLEAPYGVRGCWMYCEHLLLLKLAFFFWFFVPNLF